MAESKTPIRPEESLAKMIDSLKEKTGRTLDEWKALIAKTPWKKHGEIVAGLKNEHGVSHGYANQIALRTVESGQQVAGEPTGDLFAKRPEA